ncbi:hypothetical protein ACF090_22825 [Streptomyces sp. NPDC014892]|uniref:hypothetical protein n=1 Tax=Streptomyces sp. NPDC014892 TaxID=3364930 RepID=UPI0036F7A825
MAISSPVVFEVVMSRGAGRVVAGWLQHEDLRVCWARESPRLGTGGRGAEKEFCGDLVVRASADDEREHLAARFAELRQIRGLSEFVDDSFRWGS